MPARWTFRDGAWYFEPGRWAPGPPVVAAPPPPPPPPAYQPPLPVRQPPPPRRLSREEALRRAYEIASGYGVRPLSVREVESDDRVWKVKLLLDGGGKAKIEIDPWSGAELRFKVDGECKPNQYWDGEHCRHKGKGKGARKHDDD